MTTAAALLFAVATAVVIAFQVAPQAVALSLAAVVVLSDARFVMPSLAATFPWLIWLVVAFSAVSLVLNTLTPSVRERRIWAPVALAMLVSA